MTCPNCNTPKDFDSRYCKKCGLPLFQSPVAAFSSPPVPQKTSSEKSLNYLLIIIGLVCAELLVYKFIDKALNYNGNLSSMAYTASSWGFNLTILILSVLFIVKTKIPLVRIVLIVYAIIVLYNFVEYDILPLFQSSVDFIYYKF